MPYPSHPSADASSYSPSEPPHSSPSARLRVTLNPNRAHPGKTVSLAMLSMVIMAVACGIDMYSSPAPEPSSLIVSIAKSPGAKLTDSIAKTEDHAQKTVDALMAANRVIVGQNTGSNAVSETGVVGRFFIPSRAYAQEVPEDGTKQQKDIETLRSEWGPRYKAAQDSYAELNSHIANSERYADEYFRQQREHIESLRDADNVHTIRTAMENTYDQQMRYYEDWIDSAYMVRKQCGAILDNMHNINTLIEFTSDAADFQTLLDEQVAIPEVIASLNQAMSDFQSRTQGILGQLEGQPSESQGSAGPFPPVASTATRYPTPAPTSQPTYTPYPSPGPADTPTPEPTLAPSPTPTAVATPEPTAVPTPTAPPVTPTPVPLSVDVVNVSFVGTGYTLYLEIPEIPGGDAHEEVRLVVSNQIGVIKDEHQNFVRARNGAYVGAVVLDSDLLPNPDIEWVNANLTIHAIP